MKILLSGGPNHGKMLEIDITYPEIHVPHIEELPLNWWDREDLLSPTILKIDIYKRSPTSERIYVFDGTR